MRRSALSIQIVVLLATASVWFTKTLAFQGQLMRQTCSLTKRSLPFKEECHYRQSTALSAVEDDDEIRPPAYEKMLDNQIVLALSSRGFQAFDFVSSERLTAESLVAWERKVDAVVAEIKQLTEKEVLLAIYALVLNKAGPLVLDPLQMATFQLISTAATDTLIKLYPVNTPITELIDEVTEIHLSFIDKFQQMIDDGGSEGYSQSQKQEYLAYQLAILLKKTYTRISRGLGSSFDQSIASQDLRVSNWVGPVYARLQRRFVRFLSSNVEEKEDEIYLQAFDKLLDKIDYEVHPKYTLSLSEAVEQDEVSKISSGSDARHYPAWDLADFVTKLLRNIISTFDVQGLEVRVARAFQTHLSTKMRPLGRPLEQILEKKGAGAVALTSKEKQQLEDMLNIGHSAVAATFAIWQIRHNIVGVPDAEGKPEKDFLRPVQLTSLTAAMESLPKILRNEVLFTVDEVASRLKASDTLQAAAAVAHAVRITAGEEMRALITYNSDEDDWPVSRDQSYVCVLTGVLTEALTSPAFDVHALHENGIALAALEEAIGAREPRAACRQGYKNALRNAALQLVRSKSRSSESGTNYGERVKELERMLGMLLRLPQGAGSAARVEAFKDCINSIIENAEKNGLPGLREVNEVYPWIAQMLFIDPNVAKNYVEPLGQAKFDKAVGNMLMTADIAVSMPEMGSVFRQQLRDLAESSMIKAEVAEERTLYLAAAVFESFLETALETARQLQTDRSDLLLRKAYTLLKHPLLVQLQENKVAVTGVRSGVVDVGVKMTIARLGTSLTMDLMRVLEGTRQRISDDSAASAVAGWGSSVAARDKDPQYLAFLQTVQAAFLKEYAAGNMKRGYSSK